MAGHVFETLGRSGAGSWAQAVRHAHDGQLPDRKGFRHFGHDITSEDHVLEAGLGFAVKTTSRVSSAATRCWQKGNGSGERLVQFKLTDPEPCSYHNEPVVRTARLSGYLSSGNMATIGRRDGHGICSVFR